MATQIQRLTFGVINSIKSPMTQITHLGASDGSSDGCYFIQIYRCAYMDLIFPRWKNGVFCVMHFFCHVCQWTSLTWRLSDWGKDGTQGSALPWCWPSWAVYKKQLHKMRKACVDSLTIAQSVSPVGPSLQHKPLEHKLMVGTIVVSQLRVAKLVIHMMQALYYTLCTVSNDEKCKRWKLLPLHSWGENRFRDVHLLLQGETPGLLKSSGLTPSST